MKCAIDHFTVKVTQYSRGQTFEFYDSQKGDNEMFLMIFLWRSWAIVMKLGSCLPHCLSFHFRLKNWVVMDRSLIINLSPYLADTNKRIKELTIKSEIMIEDKRYLAPRSILIWGIVIWQVFLKLMPRSLFIHEKGKGQLMTQCQTPVKHAQKFVKIVEARHQLPYYDASYQ